MKKWLLIAAAGLVLVVVAVLAAGAMLPVGHVASHSAWYDQPQSVVWATITDFEAGPGWRSGIDSVDRLPDRDGMPVWVENGTLGPMPIAVEELDAPRRMVTRIADPDMPFGGTWTYELTPENGGTRLTITETGEVYNLFFRFMSRFVFGYTATMDAYLRDLGRKFGKEVEPGPLSGAMRWVSPGYEPPAASPLLQALHECVHQIQRAEDAHQLAVAQHEQMVQVPLTHDEGCFVNLPIRVHVEEIGGHDLRRRRVGRVLLDEVGGGDDADGMVLVVEDGQGVDLMVGHQIAQIRHRVAGRGDDDEVAHDITNTHLSGPLACALLS